MYFMVTESKSGIMLFLMWIEVRKFQPNVEVWKLAGGFYDMAVKAISKPSNHIFPSKINSVLKTTRNKIKYMNKTIHTS